MARVIPPWEQNLTHGGATIVFQRNEEDSESAITSSGHPSPAITCASQRSDPRSSRTSSSSSTTHCSCCPQHKSNQTTSRTSASKLGTKASRKNSIPQIIVRELTPKPSRSKLRKTSVAQQPPCPPLDLDLSQAEMDMLWMLPGIYETYHQEFARTEEGEEDSEKRAFRLSRIKAKLRERLRELVGNSKEGIKNMWNHDDDDDDDDPWRN